MHHDASFLGQLESGHSEADANIRITSADAINAAKGTLVVFVGLSL